MVINTYGYKMTGIKKVAGYTKDERVSPYGCSVEIFYNLPTGQCWPVWQISDSTWSVYHDDNIIPVWRAHHAMTMQEIADVIYEAIKRHEEEEIPLF